MRRGWHGKTWVYVIRCDMTDAVKIGVSADPEKRLAQLQTACPGKLAIVGTVEGGEILEAELHAKFADRRLQGEWFRIEDHEIQDMLHPPELEPRTCELPRQLMPPPRWVHNWRRADELIDAIHEGKARGRYRAEWVEELAEIFPSVIAGMLEAEEFRRRVGVDGDLLIEAESAVPSPSLWRDNN